MRATIDIYYCCFNITTQLPGLIKQLLNLILVFLLCSFTQQAMAQFTTISGNVYDISGRRPLEAVAVLSSFGKGTITDSTGHYSITVRTKDSIWFSLIGKTTMKYPVDTISNSTAFDIMIHLRATELPEVKVRNSYYKFDSLQNRSDYAKVFNFKKPGIRLSTNKNYSPGGVTVGLDLNELINMFRFKRNRQLLSLQKRLLQQEQDAYIDHRFSKAFVRKITKLNSPELETFMQTYRPHYAWVQTLNDLELGYYVTQCLKAYNNHLAAPYNGFGYRSANDDDD